MKIDGKSTRKTEKVYIKNWRALRRGDLAPQAAKVYIKKLRGLNMDILGGIPVSFGLVAVLLFPRGRPVGKKAAFPLVKGMLFPW